MGLFDRLFGKKKEEEKVEDLTQEEIVEELVDEVVLEDNQEQVSDIEAIEDVQETDDMSTEEATTKEDESESVELIGDHSEEPTVEKSSEVVEETVSEELVSQAENDFYAEYLRQKERINQAIANGEDLSQFSQKTQDEQIVVEETSVDAIEEVVETEEEKYSRTLKKTRTGFGAMLNNFLANFRRVDEEFFEELEEMLILSDVGVTVATNLTEELRQEAKLENAKKPEDLKRVIIEKLVELYEKDGFENEKINMQPDLTVMLFVGVNGVGKTTSIGKLAYKYKKAGKKVMLVAADTFRAGAVAQLVEWGRRVDVPVVVGPEKADPASVVFDGMEKAVAEGVDILLIDTAGRLQNKENLMAELEKIGRIVKRVLPDAPHETLLALDASTGQNALVQAKEFSKITPLTGIVLTKLDGTAKGGVVLAIREELDIPVKFIGFGEKIDDIGQFNSEDFMKGLLEGLI